MKACTFELDIHGIKIEALIAIIDLEFKMYTKLKKYVVTWDNQCDRYLKWAYTEYCTLGGVLSVNLGSAITLN